MNDDCLLLGLHFLTLCFLKVSNLSLQERSQLQRAKQLRFLREQGLIQNEMQVKGGACDASSVTSSSVQMSPLK